MGKRKAKKTEETAPDAGAGRPAYAGVDTHKDSHVLALTDALGRKIGAWRFDATPEGYAELAAAIGDASVPVGVEGTRSYGKGLAEHLMAAGHPVLEMVRPRREQRRRGKSDEIDAYAAAENLAKGEGLPVKLAEGAAGEVAALMTAREQLVKSMSQLSACADSMLVTGPEGLRARWSGLAPAARMEGLAAAGAEGCGAALAALAAAWSFMRGAADGLEAMMASALRASQPALAGALGVGTVVAGRIVQAAGSNPERLKSEAAFSMLCGTSPIPASTGKSTGRHRLNRGGNRQANRAIHEIARVRMACDPRTRSYIERKVAKGFTKREAVRCLCRYIAREVYGLLTRPQPEVPDAAELARRRKALGLTQADVAREMGVHPRRIGYLEQGRKFDLAMLQEYESVVEKAESKKASISH